MTPGGSFEAATVRDAVASALPAAAPVRALQRIELGFGNENWMATTGLGRVVVKVGLPAASVAKWRAAARALDFARAAGVGAPELLAFVDVCDALDGRVLRVFSYVPGRSPADLDDERARARFYAQLGDAVARLHRVELPGFTSRIGSRDAVFDRWSRYLDYRWVGVCERAARTELDPAVVEHARAVVLDLAAGFDAVTRPVLCHRDLYPDNLCCDAVGNLVALLDFDMAEAWEPAADFHKLRWWNFDRYPEAETAFRAGYGPPPAGGDFDERVRAVEIVELVNGLANWKGTAAPELVVAAEVRLRRLLDR